MPDALRLHEAAKQLGRSPATLRRWIAQGAPTVFLGREGRGCGSLVNIGDLQRWRRGGDLSTPDNTDSLARLSITLWRVFKCDSGVGDAGYPAHRLLGIRDYQAAALLVEVYERYVQDLIGSVPDLPPEIQLLVSLVRQTAHK